MVLEDYLEIVKDFNLKGVTIPIMRGIVYEFQYGVTEREAHYWVRQYYEMEKQNGLRNKR